MKASSARVNGEWRDVFKDPATDPGKRSKRGRLAVVRNADGALETVREDELGDRENLLRVVFRNGDLVVDDNLAAIRARAV